jgi:Fe-Mn family superoxide dismutase
MIAPSRRDAAPSGAFPPSVLNRSETSHMAFELPALPFSTSALAERGMCQETLELHHGKHHQAYVTALNGFVEKNDALKGKSLEEIIHAAHGHADMAPVFNNAGQHWNHILFWQNLSPAGGGIPGKLEHKITEDFGGVAQFKDAFKAAAIGQFGSGWAWLVLASDGKLKITKTPNGSNPVATGEGKALLGLDVWEHSYYLDFRNRRPDYAQNFLDKLANYEFAASHL